LVIGGIELDGFDSAGVYFHVLALGASLKLPTTTRNFLKTLQAARHQGALLILAHPYWTGNSPLEGLRHNFDGMEIYNHSSQCENGSGHALSHWDSALQRHPDFLGFATDDSHFLPGNLCASHRAADGRPMDQGRGRQTPSTGRISAPDRLALCPPGDRRR